MVSERYLQQSGGVAGPEDPVHAGIPIGLRRREVRGERAVVLASPPQVLARRAPPRICGLLVELYVAGAISRHDRSGGDFLGEVGRFRGSPVDFRVILWRLICAEVESIVGRRAPRMVTATATVGGEHAMLVFLTWSMQC
jgi:hypothetical protein